MISKIVIRQFKSLEETEFELGADPLVLVGPNNSGKSSILQALAMWNTGNQEWKLHTARKKTAKSSKRTRAEFRLDHIPVLAAPEASLIWRNRSVRDGTRNIRISVEVAGKSNGSEWLAGMEFTYSRHNAIYCLPTPNSTPGWEQAVPEVAYVPPMGGLSPREQLQAPGTINQLMGHGQTADILRNVYYHLVDPQIGTEEVVERGHRAWEGINDHIGMLFGIELEKPRFNAETGYLEMAYCQRGKRFDLSCAGRGLHQTMLLLAYFYRYPNCVLLLEEPDAHLDLSAQTSLLSRLRDLAREMQSQLLITSNSERVLTEAADRGALARVECGKVLQIADEPEQAKGENAKRMLRRIGRDQTFRRRHSWDKLKAMKEINAANLRHLFAVASDQFVRHDSELCTCDGFVGDGDHGLNMRRGFNAVSEALASKRGIPQLSDVFDTAARAFMQATGGTIGPLYEAAFLRAAAATNGLKVLDASGYASVIEAMAEGIRARGKARAGEKTMLDAWLGAAAYARKAVEEGDSLRYVAAAAACGASLASNETDGMKATKGLAARAGARSKNGIDPGAFSTARLLQDFEAAVAGEFAAN